MCTGTIQFCREGNCTCHAFKEAFCRCQGISVPGPASGSGEKPGYAKRSRGIARASLLHNKGENCLLFQSFEFAAFLLCVLCIFFLVPARARVAVLTLANLVFFCYAASYAVIWLLVSVVSTYWCARLLEKCSERKYRIRLTAACIVINVGLLAVFRYFPLWDNLINTAYGHGLRKVKLDIAGDLGLLAPLGISFYTLQALGYLLDVSRGKYAAEKSFLKYAAFVSFFPNITSGPIQRADFFLPQLEKMVSATRRSLLDYDRMLQGCAGILWGFFLKMVIADRVSVSVDYLYRMYQNTDSFTMLAAALFYAVQIYCDFASYSCIAAGVARLMGFEPVQNFRQPYLAVGIRDFWDRWHMSLSSWLKDYIYIPLGGSRCSFVRRNINVLITFLVSGLWHGGAFRYLVWGMLHGLFQVLENCGILMARSLGVPKVKKWPAWLQAFWKLGYGLFTFGAVTCFWVFFRAESVEVARVCLTNLFTRWQGFLYVREFIFVMGLDRTEFLVAAAAIAIALFVDIISEWKKKEFSLWICETGYWSGTLFCVLLVAMIFVFGKYGTGYNPNDFIYMQF